MRTERSNGQSWRLSPSDFAFLWEECRRCFYLKVARKFYRPRTPMPKIFTKIDSLMKDYFTGRSTLDFAPGLPPGVVEFGEKWVASSPISIPDHDATCHIVGKFDSVIKFDDGSFGVLDFKTSETKDQHVPLYGRQLHSYAWALENPAPGKFGLTPVTTLGLVCVEPNRIYQETDGDIGYGATSTWIECPRDDEAFLCFLGEIVDLLESPEPPAGSADCVWCQYRDVARRIVA